MCRYCQVCPSSRNAQRKCAPCASLLPYRMARGPARAGMAGVGSGSHVGRMPTILLVQGGEPFGHNVQARATGFLAFCTLSAPDAPLTLRIPTMTWKAPMRGGRDSDLQDVPSRRRVCDRGPNPASRCRIALVAPPTGSSVRPVNPSIPSSTSTGTARPVQRYSCLLTSQDPRGRSRSRDNADVLERFSP